MAPSTPPSATPANPAAVVAPATPVAVEAAAAARLAGSGVEITDVAAEAATPETLAAPVPHVPLPTVDSPDGRLKLTDDAVTVLGQTFGLRGLERADVQHVRWQLWTLLGGLGLAVVCIAFLQNWLRTLPAAAGMLLTAALLAYGQRGTNRLRLWQLSPSPLHFALPGELATWQRLTGELNRRIARTHARAAAEAAALLAAAEAARAATEGASAATEVADNPEPAPDTPAETS